MLQTWGFSETEPPVVQCADLSSRCYMHIAPFWHIKLLSWIVSGALLLNLGLGCYYREWLPEIKLCQSIELAWIKITA